MLNQFGDKKPAAGLCEEIKFCEIF